MGGCPLFFPSCLASQAGSSSSNEPVRREHTQHPPSSHRHCLKIVGSSHSCALLKQSRLVLSGAVWKWGQWALAHRLQLSEVRSLKPRTNPLHQKSFLISAEDWGTESEEGASNGLTVCSTSNRGGQPSPCPGCVPGGLPPKVPRLGLPLHSSVPHQIIPDIV